MPLPHSPSPPIPTSVYARQKVPDSPDPPNDCGSEEWFSASEEFWFWTSRRVSFTNSVTVLEAPESNGWGGVARDCQMTIDHVNEDMFNGILCDLQRFVKRLGLPVHLHHLYDDIIQETLILVHCKWETLTGLDPHVRTG